MYCTPILQQFFREVLESVRGAIEGGQAQGVMVEINASKHAYNVPPQQLLEAVIRWVVVEIYYLFSAFSWLW